MIQRIIERVRETFINKKEEFEKRIISHCYKLFIDEMEENKIKIFIDEMEENKIEINYIDCNGCKGTGTIRHAILNIVDETKVVRFRYDNTTIRKIGFNTLEKGDCSFNIDNNTNTSFMKEYNFEEVKKLLKK